MILGSQSSGAVYRETHPNRLQRSINALFAPGWIKVEAAFNTDTPEGMKLYRAISAFIAPDIKRI